MNLIVFTPASRKSAIARMAALVTRELVAQGCEVTVVRTEASHLLSSDVHDFGTRILSWDEEADVRALIQSSDAGIYQIGDNFEYHEGGVRWLAEFPALVCLHDFFLGHLFYGWAQTHRAQANVVLQRWYGEEMAERFFSFTDSASFIEGTREVMPMTEWVCSQANGVLTHSRWGCDRVLSSCSGPIQVVPLAYDIPVAANDVIERLSPECGTLQVLTIGHVNPNKRIVSVIEAIGFDEELRKHVNYRLVGAIQPDMKKSLFSLAKRLGVNLTISGEVGDTELARAINGSDVISCLRWPSLESASASAIEGMLYGKVVIVTDAGFYKDIPDSYAIKINVANEVAELQTALYEALGDKNQLQKMGNEAREWASQTFSAEKYSTHLLGVIKETTIVKPILKSVGIFSDALSSWSLNANMEFLSDVIDRLDVFRISD